jgi:stalled ribosome alternative rescue factor ArfA
MTTKWTIPKWMRNKAAKSLAEGQYQPRTIRPKKGKGSYNRKDVGNAKEEV